MVVVENTKDKCNRILTLFRLGFFRSSWALGKGGGGGVGGELSSIDAIVMKL